MQNTRFRCLKFTLTAIVTLVILGVGASYTRNLWLPGVAEVLVRDDQLHETQDYLILLMGDMRQRPKAAAGYYESGRVKRILMARAEDSDAVKFGLMRSEAELSRELIIKYGVPSSVIETVNAPPNTSTYDEARCYLKFLREHPEVKKVALLTSWYHSSRALWTFQRIFEGSGITLSVVTAPTSGFTAGNWWTSEVGMITIFSEYIKWFHNYRRLAHLSAK